MRGSSDLVWNTTYALAVGSAGLWVAVGPRSLVRVDPATNEITDTVPIKEATKVMDAFVESVLSCVEDPATAQNIHKCLRQSKRSVRDRTTKKKSNPQPPRGRMP